MAFGMWLPYSPLASSLGLTSLPGLYWPILMLTLLCYVGLTQAVKVWLLRMEDIPRPRLEAGHVLLCVVACGVCRTDLHIFEGDLPPVKPQLIPGHQIVGEVIEGATTELPLGTRVGVSWMGGVDGDCWYCHQGIEKLFNRPTFTGYTVNGGFAEYALARTDFSFPLPVGLDDVHVAPLLCAGIIGFRSLRVAGVEHGERVGLFGFGSSASLAIPILQS